MPNQAAKVVSAIFAGVLAGVALTIANGTAHAADDCLAGPKDKTPQGSHWYYRIEHATKRHCWYLGDAHQKSSQNASNATPAAKPVAPKTDTATQRSISDAHAELPMPQMPVEQQTSADAGQLSAATAANTAGIDDSQRANAGDGNKQLSVIASRWPDSDLSSSDDPAPTTVASDTNAPSSSPTAPPSLAAAVPLAAADSSAENQAGSLQMLLIVIAGALAFAGIIGATVFRFGGMRQLAYGEVRIDRRTIWEPADTDRASTPPPWVAHARANGPRRRVSIPHEPREAEDPNDRIVEMLAQLRKSSAN